MKLLLENWKKFLNEEKEKTYFHVTEKAHADEIREKGFLAGWGDVGFGIYFFDSLAAAKHYAKKGGWDGDLEEPMVLAVKDERIRPIYDDEISPEWPNPEDYKSIYFLEGDEDNEDKHIVPKSIEVVNFEGEEG